MNKEELDINQELEQMRQAYAALKERYDKQQIITEDLLQKAMKKDVRRLFLSKKSTVCAAAVLAAAIIFFYLRGYEWWIIISLGIFGLLSVLGVFWAYKGVREEDIYNGDILSTAETLRQFKKRYVILVSGICIYFFAFVIAGMFYLTTMNISTEIMWRRGIIVAVLCVGSLTLEYNSAKRLLKACDDIIERLKMKDER